ncbi:MAG: hypothetical protein ABSE22_04540 [Xanthobacteraceae bacterium]|jgi:hypothetical protein
MSMDPLALPAIAAVAPQESEYDAVYAAVTATERGRWLLTEYGNRNRHAETHLVLAAIARVDAAVRGDVAPHSPVALWRDLTGIAATIEQARAAIAAEQPLAPAVGAALERIQDVAFGLRERAADAALCDALDAAAGEISDACADRSTRGKSGRKVAESLRELADRVDKLIQSSLAEKASGEPPPVITPAVAAAESSSAPIEQIERRAPDAGEDDDLARSPLFAMDLQQSKRLSEAAATLATSLTSAASALDPKTERAAANIAPLGDPAPSGPQADNGTRWFIESPDFVFHRSAPEPELEPVQSELSDPSGTAHALLPETGLHSGPPDDPADLVKDATAEVATVPIAAPASFAVMSAVAEVPSPQYRIANSPGVRVIARPSPGDSLAAVRNLSAEELIALFG